MRRLQLGLAILGLGLGGLVAVPAAQVELTRGLSLARLTDGSLAAPSLTFAAEPATGLWRPGPSFLGFGVSGADTLRLGSGRVIVGASQFEFGASLATSDVLLIRDAANLLAMRNGVVGQTFAIYPTYTDVNNYERLEFLASPSTAPVIGNRVLGTGVQRGLVLRGNIGAGTGWTVDATNTLKTETDNAVDIGATGANRPRNVYVGSGILAPNLLVSTTTPTLTGFGTGAAVVNPNGAGAFTVNVGTGGVATSGVITLPTATSGWNCFATDITTTSATVFVTKQTASSTTSATLGNFNTSGAAAAWVASDILAVSCFGR
jgi:hypothetical protein